MDTFYVGATRAFGTADLAAGRLKHLGIGWDGGQVQFDSAIVPPPSVGRWSNYNANGREVTRKDLPKQPKTMGGWLAPDFGDPSKGEHIVTWTRDVYRKETWHGQQLPILIDVQDPIDGKVTVGFRVDRVFQKDNYEERDLLLACSLIRENAGTHASVVATDVSVASWLDTQFVDWKILPEGEATFERVVERLGVKSSSPRVREAKGRFEAIRKMNPDKTVVGEGGFSRYFGFMFREELVALECLNYGNALYLMYEDWAQLSKRPRVDLLADPDAEYDRVVHQGGWEKRLKQLLRSRGHEPR
ncbi:hypothetical protein [Isoptericola sp. b408]|uniref:hypothetical protein n=1 Tax=Isoptericola sp. b408 TaxID=3064653 RepID=UPI002713928F|nr:hypothetical protein [Isoptericola sp. b408]MDO8151711.1 hypothetical protein [Isoptericola sp. b408]